jgi:hypothetical protein
MRLVTSVILSSKTPIDVREDRLVSEVYCPKDTAAYTYSPLVQGAVMKRGTYELLGHFQLKTYGNCSRELRKSVADDAGVSITKLSQILNSIVGFLPA